MVEQSIKNSNSTRFFNLIEKVILWFIRKKCPITFVGKTLITVGIGFISPPFLLEIFKFLFINLFEEKTTSKISIEYDYILTVFGFFLIILGISILILNHFKYFNKYLLNKKVVIKQYSMGPPIFNNLISLKEEYNTIEYDINLIKFLDFNNMVPQKIIKGITYQDKICRKIRSFKTKTGIENLIFCSITSLPFVARLGAKLGNEQKCEFYENNQISGTGFFKLENIPFSENIYVIDEILNDNSEELILAIGITKPIIKENLPKKFSTCNYINIEHPEAKKLPSNRDAISSTKQLIIYRDFIKSQIIRLDKIKIIHIFYSGQTCLMFSLISSFNKNYENYKIIVYHFYNGKYIWGMDIYENYPRNALVYL
ncbi:MAG: SAVED domain-containing protein [Fusobacteriaceae bacterium]